MSSNKPTVTWMIPVLNGMQYLPMTLQSIEQQTFSNFQVVIWDNGSIDGTVEEATRWIPSRLPGTIIADRPMLLGLARGAMVEQFDTEFCALVDADDVNHPQRLAKQIEFMRSHPDVAALGTQLRRLSSTGQDLGTFSHYPLNHDQIVQEMLLSNPIGQPSVIFRREAVLAAGNYRDFSPTHVEDYDLWLRMAAKGFQLANLPDELVNYRVHEKSTTQKSIAANRLETQMLECLADAAPVLYGCSRDMIKQLRSREAPSPVVQLSQIAKHLGNENQIWKSPIFYHAARQMIAKTDVRSRAAVALKSCGLLGVPLELASISMDLARSVGRAVIGKQPM